MIAPCYQCPAVFDTQAERAKHVFTQHRQHPEPIVMRPSHGKGKILAQFLQHATPEQRRRFNELAGHHQHADNSTCG